MKKYVIALDAGTTSSRAMLIDRAGRPVASVQRPFPQIYPQPGWVEHDPQDILSSQLGALTELIMSSNVDTAEIDSIGITNQRETTIVWDRATGEPIMNAIVWQCRRTAPMVEAIASDPATAAEITARTGLVPDAYFSASKLAWILGEVPGARARAEAGELCFGTVDSWLIWKLTDGAVHATDVTNASRTMLYNIHERRWDPFLLKLFGIPEAILPEVRPSSGSFGITANPGLVQGIPICGVAGDQQAALFGQCCFHAGQAKNTYGTGCFLLMHTGHEACASEHGLVTTVAASAPNAGDTEYALEGSVFMAGALIQWLRDELGIIDSVAETDAIARSVATTDGVFVVPAFTGLGAPWWDADARGAILGLTRGAGRAHIVRAASGVDRLPGVRLGPRHGRGRAHAAFGAERRWGSGGQRLPHAVPSRHARRAPAPPRQRRDHRARCRLPGRPFHGLLEEHRGAGGPARGGGSLPALPSTSRCAPPASPPGAKPSPAFAASGFARLSRFGAESVSEGARRRSSAYNTASRHSRRKGSGPCA